MQKTVAIAHWIVRVAGVIQLTLGALFWTGHAYTYVPVHIVVGSVLVLALWLVAVLALVARVKRGLAVFELVWGLALVWFGVQQAGFLVGGCTGSSEWCTCSWRCRRWGSLGRWGRLSAAHAW